MVSSVDPMPFPLSGIHRQRPKAIVPVIPYKSEAGQVEAREFLSLSPQPEEIKEQREIWNTWAEDENFILPLASPRSGLQVN